MDLLVLWFVCLLICCLRAWEFGVSCWLYGVVFVVDVVIVAVEGLCFTLDFGETCLLVLICFNCFTFVVDLDICWFGFNLFCLWVAFLVFALFNLFIKLYSFCFMLPLVIRSVRFDLELLWVLVGFICVWMILWVFRVLL